MVLHLIPITDDAPTIEAIASRLAVIISPYPSDRERVARLLIEFAEEIERKAQA